ncbi:MAG TPA: hypothetical protein VJB65_05320 [Patescibacteria group bacterium]|nr:hypothetical protein [Patescibacteria group bacterium]
MAFAHNTPVQFIPGIGARTAAVLHELDIHTISELVRVPEKVLIELFGPSIRSVLTLIGSTQQKHIYSVHSHIQQPTFKQEKKSFMKRLHLAAQFVMML